MNEERAAQIIPLLEIQPYIRDVFWKPEAHGFNIDCFRNHWRANMNISDIVHRWLKLPPAPLELPWLFVNYARLVAPVVFARSARYRNRRFPWRNVYNQYKDQAVFVGLPEEHTNFCREVGPIGYYHCKDLLELAEVIEGCQLFVGNQSSPRAIAEGLKKPVLVEQCRVQHDTHFKRMSAWYSGLYLPDINNDPCWRSRPDMVLVK